MAAVSLGSTTEDPKVGQPDMLSFVNKKDGVYYHKVVSKAAAIAKEILAIKKTKLTLCTRTYP